MTTRFILLGASNLAISFPRLQNHLASSSSTGAEVWGAFGHGRSYGLPTRVLGRGMPSITHCGLWDALAARPAAETHALVADVGNDLLFGPSVDAIVSWVEGCVEKLSALSGRVAVQGLPMASIEALPAARFLFFRTLLYPNCAKPWQQIRDEAQSLNAALREIAQRHGALFLEPRPEWYGLDPVHIRPRALTTAWEEILQGWLAGLENHLAPRIGWRRHLRLWTLSPAERTLWGRPRQTRQPALEEGDGSVVFLF